MQDMEFWEILIFIATALVTGFILGFFYVRSQISAIDARYRAELETWKLQAAGEIRKDSVNRSRASLKGRIAEQMAPLLPEFSYNPADARFIGSPVDYIIFDGLSEISDEKNKEIQIVFMDVKHGTAKLSATQRIIREAVSAGRIRWETLRTGGN